MPEENLKPGPKPETIDIVKGEPDWKDALKHAMSKPKPKRDEVEGGNHTRGGQRENEDKD